MGNQQFQGNNNPMQQGQLQQMNRGGNMMGSNVPKNDWDQFFQQTNVPAVSNTRVMNNNQGNQGNFNNQMGSNDQAANLLLRNALLQQQQQGNVSIDSNLKQSLARTVGLVGGNMSNNPNNNMGNNMNMGQMQGKHNLWLNHFGLRLYFRSWECRYE